MQEATEADVEVTDTVVATDVVDAEVVPQLPKPPVNVMLDLETWGNGNKAAIISIGACKFDENEILDAFHDGIDPASCQAFGLEVDADTIMWWMDPERDAARAEWLKLQRIDLASALLGFELWCKNSPEVIAIWGNGSTFDNIILRSAYAATGQQYPVSFRQDRCYRTMRDLTATAMVREGTHHSALDDAVSQAKHLQRIWREHDRSDLREMLEKCRDQFGFYAAQHRAKVDKWQDDRVSSDDLSEQLDLDDKIAGTTRKAEVNEKFEQQIGQLLDGGPVQV